MFQISKIMQHGYSTVSNMRQYGQKWYIFLQFFILFSLSTLFTFSFLFSFTGSLSLLLVPVIISILVFQDLRLIRDVHRQQLRHSSDDDNTLRRQGLGGQLLGNAQTQSGLFVELIGSLSLTSVPLTDSFQSFSPSKAATADLA